MQSPVQPSSPRLFSWPHSPSHIDIFPGAVCRAPFDALFNPRGRNGASIGVQQPFSDHAVTPKREAVGARPGSLVGQVLQAADAATTGSGCLYRTPARDSVAPDTQAAEPPMSPRQPLAEPADVVCCLAWF